MNLKRNYVSFKKKDFFCGTEKWHYFKSDRCYLIVAPFQSVYFVPWVKNESKKKVKEPSVPDWGYSSGYVSVRVAIDLGQSIVFLYFFPLRGDQLSEIRIKTYRGSFSASFSSQSRKDGLFYSCIYILNLNNKETMGSKWNLNETENHKLDYMLQ